MKTHCKNGHEFTNENTYTPPDGGKCCRLCRRERERKYREQNRDRVRAKYRRWQKLHQREWQEENREKTQTHARRWREQHKEQHAAFNLQWKIENPEKIREYGLRRRAIKLDQLGEWPLPLVEIEELLLRTIQFGKCFYCPVSIMGGKYHRDPIVPLARGGLHDYQNLCLSCPECNLRKHTKTSEEFRKTQER